MPRRLDGKVWGVTASYISYRFAWACKEVGIEDLRFHNLRHMATSRLFELGLTQLGVASITDIET